MKRFVGLCFTGVAFVGFGSLDLAGAAGSDLVSEDFGSVSEGFEPVLGDGWSVGLADGPVDLEDLEVPGGV